jgi:tryptophan-rich sensory protein
MGDFSSQRSFEREPREKMVESIEEPVEHKTMAIVVGVLWILAVMIGGLVIGLLSRLTGSKAVKTKHGYNFYDIVRPSIAPAPVAFSILWTLLFALFGAGGVAFVLPWLMNKEVSKTKQIRMILASIFYLAVLGLLYAWMPVFANRQQPKKAAYILIATLVLYAPLMFLAGSVSKWSLIFLSPLFAWLIVALVMNSESVAKWEAYVKHYKVQSMKETMSTVAGMGHAA